MAPRSYPSLGAFYAADPRRARSRETDLGLWWRSDRIPGPTFRAAWVESTGEVYVMQHEGMRGGGHVEVLAHAPTLADIQAALGDYEAVIDEPDSISWLRRVLAQPALAAVGEVALQLAA